MSLTRVGLPVTSGNKADLTGISLVVQERIRLVSSRRDWNPSTKMQHAAGLHEPVVVFSSARRFLHQNELFFFSSSTPL